LKIPAPFQTERIKRGAKKQLFPLHRYGRFHIAERAHKMPSRLSGQAVKKQALKIAYAFPPRAQKARTNGTNRKAPHVRRPINPDAVYAICFWNR